MSFHDADIINNGGGAKAYLLDLFFPNRCPFCGKFISYDLLCCKSCFDSVLWADDNICLVCGKSLIGDCVCAKEERRFDMCIPAAYYKDKAKRAVYDLKFHTGHNGSEIFGRVLRGRLDAMGLTSSIDAAIPVPMSRKQFKARGYNQAERITRAIIAGTSIPLETKLLIRNNVRVSQHMLGAEERRAAANEQYSAAASDKLSGKTVLLVDDVLTTGATLDRCSALLKERLHAKRVICAVAATA